MNKVFLFIDIYALSTRVSRLCLYKVVPLPTPERFYAYSLVFVMLLGAPLCLHITSKMADVWLTSMEQRLDELENRVFGASDKEINYPKVVLAYLCVVCLHLYPQISLN